MEGKGQEKRGGEEGRGRGEGKRGGGEGRGRGEGNEGRKTLRQLSY